MWCDFFGHCRTSVTWWHPCAILRRFIFCYFIFECSKLRRWFLIEKRKLFKRFFLLSWSIDDATGTYTTSCLHWRQEPLLCESESDIWWLLRFSLSLKEMCLLKAIISGDWASHLSWQKQNHRTFQNENNTDNSAQEETGLQTMPTSFPPKVSVPKNTGFSFLTWSVNWGCKSVSTWQQVHPIHGRMY